MDPQVNNGVALERLNTSSKRSGKSSQEIIITVCSGGNKQGCKAPCPQREERREREIK